MQGLDSGLTVCVSAESKICYFEDEIAFIHETAGNDQLHKSPDTSECACRCVCYWLPLTFIYTTLHSRVDHGGALGFGGGFGCGALCGGLLLLFGRTLAFPLLVLRQRLLVC